MVATRLLTAEAFWAMRDDPDRLDLIEGALYRMPGASGRHARVSSRVDRRLGDYVERHELGEVYIECGFYLHADRDTVLVPDVAFVRSERVPTGDAEMAFLKLAPDLAIEIVSPSDYPKLVADKVAAYLAAGTSQVWAMEPDQRTIRIHQPGRETVALGPNDTLTGGDLLPGFAIRVADLFPA